MHAKKDNPNPSIYPRPLQEHRKQVIEQIWLPLAGAILVALAIFTISIIVTTDDSLTGIKIAGAAEIILIIPTMLCSIIPLALLIGCTILFKKILYKTPTLALRVQLAFYRLQHLIYSLSDKSVRPIITYESRWAGLKQLLKSVTNFLQIH